MKTVTEPNNAKIFTSKLNFKVQNIYIKPLLKPKNTFNNPCFETVYLGEGLKKLFKHKAAQNVPNTWAFSCFQKAKLSFQK
jgi:hypothetical protein